MLFVRAGVGGAADALEESVLVRDTAGRGSLGSRLGGGAKELGSLRDDSGLETWSFLSSASDLRPMRLPCATL